RRILEGDIKSCFDKISHDWLLAHVPMDRVILQKWLKSGYMEKHVLHDTTEGTPQGGILTPLTQKPSSDDVLPCGSIQTESEAGMRPVSLAGWSIHPRGGMCDCAPTAGDGQRLRLFKP